MKEHLPMRKNLLRAILAVALIFPAFAVAPTLVLADQGPCGQLSTPELYNGSTNPWSGGTGTDRSGVKAFLLLDSGFDVCSFSGLDFRGGVAAYIELSPQVQPSTCAPTGCAIRLGVIECNGDIPGSPDNLCKSPTGMRAFYQSLGCGTQGYVSLSQWAPFSDPIEFSMYDTGANTLRLSIGGATVANMSMTSNERINCWIGYASIPAKAVWMARKYDGPGDSLGLYPVPGVNWTDARYGLLNQGWIGQPFAGSATQCHYETTGSGDECWTSAFDNLYATTR